MKSPGVNKFDRLPDALALILVALVAFWIVREQGYAGLIGFIIVVAIWLTRVRKAPRMPNGPAGITLAAVVAFFAGAFGIVFVGIIRPEIALPTALAVVAIYTALVVLGRRVRLSARTTPHDSH